MDKLISVIIPVYNVENYISEAITSVCKQSYKNLEIILVNDGSTDNSPQICNNFAQIDNRIIVIHKQNGGLSSARNAGLNIASGEYIGFIDSDDYISYDMYEKLLNAFNNSEKQIGIASGQILKSMNGNISPYNLLWEHNTYNIIHPKEFARKMLLTKSNFSCCTKLFQRNLLKNIRFNEKRNNEDSYFMFELSKQIEKNNIYTIEIPDYVYYYRIREDSICNSTITPLEIDIIKNYCEFRDYYKNINNKLSEEISQYITFRLYHFCHKILNNHTYIDKYYIHYITMFKTEFLTFIYNNKHLNPVQKIRLLLMSNFPQLYCKIYSLYKQL